MSEIRLKLLTPLWTGDINKNSAHLCETGLLGSMRWWLEVLVRGLDGGACDPHDTKCKDQDHCVVCELFGCTGWARKFRLDVLDENGCARVGKGNGEPKFRPQPVKDETVTIRFTPLRPINLNEWALIDATLRLIAGYGAMGGKTVFKPTHEQARLMESHHIDYGIVEYICANPPITSFDFNNLKDYILDSRWKKIESKTKDKDFTWASIHHFWFVDSMTLSRSNTTTSSFNQVVGRNPSKACRDCGGVHNPRSKCPMTERPAKRLSEQLVKRTDQVSEWLAGTQQESKKVFSFKNPARTFGFVKPGMIDFNEMKTRLTGVWGPNGWAFLTGDEILKQLFAGSEERP